MPISPAFDEGQLDRFEALLECEDADLFDWVSRRTVPPPAHDHDVMRLLLAFRSTPSRGMSDTTLASPPPAMERASGAGGEETALDELAGSLKARPRPVTLYGAPEGYDAAVVGRLVAAGAARRWLHVCRDDGRMARFAAALAFFHPEIEALTFPAWDCLPYDRVSPNGELVSRRIDTLTRLASADSKGASINAAHRWLC